MKGTTKDSENLLWLQMKTSITDSAHQTKTLPKILVCLILFAFCAYCMSSFKLLSRSSFCNKEIFSLNTLNKISDSSPFNPNNISVLNQKQNISVVSDDQKNISVSVSDSSQNGKKKNHKNTKQKGLYHNIVFGIAGSAKLWEQRKNYIKLWWEPNEMRGFVWLDKPVNTCTDEEGLVPPVKISSDTSHFTYTNKQGDRSGIRISRILSEAFKLGLKNVRWFVMSDDDTFIVAENLVKVLSKYDHNQFYYIGSVSESHMQNIYFSYGMAYGGGGFAISYPLAKALVDMQDECIERYPELYGSDDRMQACMAELGVPLTKEAGFHQFDMYGNPFGLLAAHPVAPLVTIHHLDVIEPIFPVPTQVEAVERLTVPMKLDSAALMQQSICYNKEKKWTVSVSWGYAVQIQRGILTPREMEKPLRTFLNWYKKTDDTGFPFNTRSVDRNPCKNPLVFYMEKARYDSSINKTVSEYVLNEVSHRLCKWKRTDVVDVDRVEVYKRPDPHMWEKSPRRNCCRIMPSYQSRRMLIDVGPCYRNEYSGL